MAIEDNYAAKSRLKIVPELYVHNAWMSRQAMSGKCVFIWHLISSP